MSQQSLPFPNAKQPLHPPYGADYYYGQHHRQQENRSHCMFKTNLCSGPLNCHYCSNSNTSNPTSDNHLNNKPWRIAFFQDDREHHQYYQQDVLRSAKSTIHQNSNTVPRRLSSGSACETCRRRKTKCDGGQPCAYCSTNRIPCIHRASKKRSAHHLNNNKQTALMMGWTTMDNNNNNNNNNATATNDDKQRLQWVEPLARQVERPLSAMDVDHHEHRSIMKQASCPSLMVTQWPQQPRGSTSPIKSLSPPSPLSDHHSMSSDKPMMSSPFADHVIKECMPSVMDQLSCRTFSAVTLAAVDRNSSYPIYPLLAGTHEHNTRRGYASD